MLADNEIEQTIIDALSNHRDEHGPSFKQVDIKMLSGLLRRNIEQKKLVRALRNLRKKGSIDEFVTSPVNDGYFVRL